MNVFKFQSLANMCIKSHRFLCNPYRFWEFHDSVKYQCPGETVPNGRRFWRAIYIYMQFYNINSYESPIYTHTRTTCSLFIEMPCNNVSCLNPFSQESEPVAQRKHDTSNNMNVSAWSLPRTKRKKELQIQIRYLCAIHRALQILHFIAKNNKPVSSLYQNPTFNYSMMGPTYESQNQRFLPSKVTVLKPRFAKRRKASLCRRQAGSHLGSENPSKKRPTFKGKMLDPSLEGISYLQYTKIKSCCVTTNLKDATNDDSFFQLPYCIILYSEANASSSMSQTPNYPTFMIAERKIPTSQFQKRFYIGNNPPKPVPFSKGEVNVGHLSNKKQ